MDELQLSGRRYISSRRLAKEHGYHSDYLGQLIRGGKIKGQKVGRAWYIDAASFEAYIGKELTSLGETENSQPIETPAAQKFMHNADPDAVAYVEKVPAAAEEAETEKTPPEKEEVYEQKISITTDAKSTTRAPQTPEPSRGLRYYADDAPLVPQIPHKITTTTFATGIATPSPAEEQISFQSERILSSDVLQMPTWRLRHALGLLVFGSVALIAVSITAGALYAHIQTDDQAANVTYGFDFSYLTSFIDIVK